MAILSKPRQLANGPNEWVSPFACGARGDGVTNDTAAISEALDLAVSRKVGLDLRGRTYLVSAGSINFARAGLHIRGGGATLKFVGTGRAFVLDADGTGTFFGTFLEGMTVEDINILGDAAGVTDGFYARGIVRSVFRNIDVYNVSGKAFWIKHGVSNHYDSLKCSNWRAGQPAPPYRPTHGLYIDNNDGTDPGGTPRVGYYTANCTFTNCVMENIRNTALSAFDGIGCEIAPSGGSGNLWDGGTFEAVRTGLIIGASNNRNRFVGIWFEGNGAAAALPGEDVKVAGNSNAFAQCYFGSACINPNVQIVAGATAITFSDQCYIRWVYINTNVGLSFHQCAVDESLGGTTGFQGPGDYTRIACSKVNGSLVAGSMYPDRLAGEKGSSTVTMTAGTSGTITLDANFNKLYWTKIGNRFEANALLLVASVSAPVGELRVPINALPYAPASGGGSAPNRTPVLVHMSNLAGGNTATAWQGFLDPGVGYIILQKVVGGAPAAMAGDVVAGTSVRIWLSFAADV